MGNSSSTTYNFTAFTEADLLAAGSGNGSNLGYGDTFTMPGCASVEFSVTDNDNRLSGDSRRNENSNDQRGQQASITQNGQEVGNGGQIYAEGYFWLCDENGNWYLLIEIEQEGSCDDYFAFHEGYGIPPAGAELTVYCGGNISCWEPKFDDLTGGEVKAGPEAVNDSIEINEDETIGDAGDDAQLNILANDTNATLAAVNGMDLNGATSVDVLVTTANGVDVTVTIDADGNLAFDTNGQFDALNDGESDSFTISYTVTGAEGGSADATATVVINGETDPVNAVDDCFIVFESEGANEPGGEGNVLANDGVDLAKTTVTEVNGDAAAVGQWVDLASGGRFRLNADGEFDFDANGAYDELRRDEKAFETVTYTSLTENDDDDVVRTIFNGPDDLEAEVIVDEVNGDLVVTVTVLENGGDIGDLRGLFFDVSDEGLLSGLDATGADVTHEKFYADRVYNLGHGANIKGSVLHEYGKFDGGVRFGTSGIGKDDIRTTTFTLSHATEDLTLDLLSAQDMGLRLTSVGAEGGHRGDSLKLGAVSTFVEAPDELRTATVKVEIRGENEGPIAQDNVYATDQNTALTANFVLDADEFNGVDSDPDGDELTVTEVVANGSLIAFDTPTTVTTDDGLFTGTLVVANDGSYSFTPGADMIALGVLDHTQISFGYTITDGQDESSADVRIEIAGRNDAPTAEDNFYVVFEDAAPATIGNIVTDPGGDAGAVDSDPDNDVLTVKSVEVGGNTFFPGDTFMVTSSVLMQEVAVTVAADGSLSFDDQGNFDALNAGETDNVSFEYTVQDGNGGEDNASVTVTIVGEDDVPPQVEYNILFLVDASAGLDDGEEHGLFLFTSPTDLNGDGNVNTVLDAELATVQQFVSTLGGLSDFSTDVEIGVQTFTSNSNLRTPNDQNITLQDNAGNSIFTSGDDLSEAFAGAGGDDGVAIWNTAIAGANDFFDFNNDGGAEVVNLLYILSDSEGTQQTVFPEDQPLATELLELQAEHDVTIDTIIYNDTDQPNQFLVPIEASGGDGVINLVENQFDLNALLGNPLLDNLDIV